VSVLCVDCSLSALIHCSAVDTATPWCFSQFRTDPTTGIRFFLAQNVWRGKQWVEMDET